MHAKAALGLCAGEGLLVASTGQPPPDRMAVLAIAFHNLGVEQEHLELTDEAIQAYEQAGSARPNCTTIAPACPK